MKLTSQMPPPASLIPSVWPAGRAPRSALQSQPPAGTIPVITWGVTMRTLILAGLLVLISSAALAQDKPGCNDHPAVSRFAGSVIIDCLSSDFDAARFPGRAGTGRAADDLAAAITLNGRVTAIRYRVPAGKSVLEVAANYRSALIAAGFTPVLELANNTVPSRVFDGPGARNNVETENWLLARRAGPDGTVHVSVAVGEDMNDRSRIGVNLRIVEERAMQTGQVTVADATVIRSGLDQAGKIALYGIYFDTGRAEVRPESAAQIREIAAFLEANPQTSVYVVGHTDMQGALAANQELSQRRAQAVVTLLTRDYGVASERLSAAGVGPLSPVASNATEEGRALNRRVEIVAR